MLFSCRFFNLPGAEEKEIKAATATATNKWDEKGERIQNGFAAAHGFGFQADALRSFSNHFHSNECAYICVFRHRIECNGTNKLTERNGMKWMYRIFIPFCCHSLSGFFVASASALSLLQKNNDRNTFSLSLNRKETFSMRDISICVSCDAHMRDSTTPFEPICISLDFFFASSSLFVALRRCRHLLLPLRFRLSHWVHVCAHDDDDISSKKKLL